MVLNQLQDVRMHICIRAYSHCKVVKVPLIGGKLFRCLS